MIPDTKPDMSLADAVTFDDVCAAADRIEGVAKRTPVMTSRTLDERVSASVFLKCENFQRAGAFKFRGAVSAISKLEPGGPGVLTYSSGNHAQAVALASNMLGIRGTIVMPNNAPAVKRRATQGYLDAGGIDGSEVVLYDPETETREEIGTKLAEERGQTIVPPYDHPDVIAGQGTAVKELIDDVGPLDMLLVCCGGGGLLSGSSISANALSPGCKVIGVEPELADDATRSFKTHELHTVRNPPTIADGARTPHLGRYTFPMVLANVHDMVTVSDDELREQMRFCFQRMKIVAEPTGVLGLAALVKFAREGGLDGAERIGVVISGGNVDLSMFSTIVDGD
ncbi:MAG: threo-3-hydroxy-L-aspartate ammonia-lyase [Phycisphaerales bacterium]